jgi:hypothetical protein
MPALLPLFAQASDADADPAAAAVGIVGLVCIGLFGLFIYFLPVFIAGMRGHPNTAAIFVLTLFLGWSFIGWVIALVWSFTAVERPVYYRRDPYDG